MYSWFDENWQYEMEIIIDSSKIDESLNYLPIAVILDSTNFDFSKAKSDGSDIRFTDSTKQTILPHEKVFYDNVSNKGLFWVKVPNISGNEDTKFYLYCGNPNASSNEAPTLVWDSYICVCHGYDNEDHTSIIDSTNSHTPVKQAENEPIETDGWLYKAQDFDGVNDKIDLNFNDNYANVTLECLINSPEVISGHSPKIFNKVSYYTSNVSDFPIQIFQSGGNNIYLGLSKGDDYNNDLQIYAHYNGFNTWNYICASVKDKDTAYIRVNDNITQSNIDFSISTNTRNWTVGRAAYPYGGGANKEQYKGLIEEIRLSNIYKPPAYSKATFYTIKNELLFYGRLGNKRKFYSILIDEGNDKKIGTVLINTDEHIQRVAHDSELIEFQKVLDATKLNGAESFWFDCNGLEKIYLKILFSNNTDTVNVRFGFLDYDNKETYSDEYTIFNSGEVDGSYYLSVIKSENVLGFQKVKIRLTSSPSAGVIGYIGGISDGVEFSKGYLIGGASNSQKEQITSEYSNQTDSWASKTNIPSPGRNALTGRSILNKSYVIYGQNNSNIPIKDTDEYEPDTWVSRTDAPSPARDYLNSSMIYHKIYVFYGYNGTTSIKDTDEYEPDTWVSRTDAPSPAKQSLAGTSIQNKGYAQCGYPLNIDNNEYEPDTWVSRTDAPSPARQHTKATTIINKGYLLFGRDGSNSLKDTDEYEPDTWVSRTDAPSPGRDGIGTTTIINKLYTFTGYSTYIGARILDSNEYNPDTWVTKTYIPSPALFAPTATTI